MNRGGVRWRRTGMLLIPALFGVLLLAGLTLFGVIPLALSLNGQNVKLTSKGATAFAPQGLQAYLDVQQMKNDGPRDPVAHAKIPEARLPDGLCLSLVLTFPVIGTNTISLDFTGKTVAKDVIAGAADLEAGQTALSAETTDGKPARPDQSNLEHPVDLGLDANQIGGSSGGFGADIPGKTTIGDLKATAKQATISGTFRMSALRIPRISHGRGTDHGECY